MPPNVPKEDRKKKEIINSVTQVVPQVVALDFTAYWQSFRTRVERLLRSDPVYFHN
jgi:hypothetical protein